MNNFNKKMTWKELSFKDKLSYSFAMVCFSLGWIITFIGFFVPPVGLVADEILYILAQSLLFTGAIIGIGQYYNAQTQNFKYEIKKLISSKSNLDEDEGDSESSE